MENMSPATYHSYTLATHFHLYSKQAHLAIRKLNSDKTSILPKKATNPEPPTLGSSSPPIGMDNNVLYQISISPRSEVNHMDVSATYAKATNE